MLCFDFIDANRFFKKIKGGKEVQHTAIFDEKNTRELAFLRRTHQKTSCLIGMQNITRAAKEKLN